MKKCAQGRKLKIDLPINSKTLSYVNENKIALQLKGSLLDNTLPDYSYHINLLFYYLSRRSRTASQYIGMINSSVILFGVDYLSTRYLNIIVLIPIITHFDGKTYLISKYYGIQLKSFHLNSTQRKKPREPLAFALKFIAPPARYSQGRLGAFEPFMVRATTCECTVNQNRQKCPI